ncbi:MAG: hypothetical protein BRD38_02675 [Bacteroidetes bacterium QH_9_67_14]|nr:MAG: hypothetical protein BRD38_02675 [Bacteroidetes bacterium QH_9_67_14]
MDVWTAGRLDGWTFGRLDVWTAGRLDGWTFGRSHFHTFTPPNQRASAKTKDEPPKTPNRQQADHGSLADGR